MGLIYSRNNAKIIPHKDSLKILKYKKSLKKEGIFKIKNGKLCFFCLKSSDGVSTPPSQPCFLASLVCLICKHEIQKLRCIDCEKEKLFNGPRLHRYIKCIKCKCRRTFLRPSRDRYKII